MLTEEAANHLASPTVPIGEHTVLVGAAAAVTTLRMPTPPEPPTSHMGIAAWPRLTAETGFIICIEGATPDAKALIAAIQREGVRQLTDRLAVVHAEFFESGIGCMYRQQQERFRATEASLATAKAKLDAVQSEWSKEIANASDTNENLDRIEADIRSADRDVQRLQARLSATRDELAKVKTLAADALNTTIAATVRTFGEITGRNLWEAKVALSEAVSAAFLNWLRAWSEHGGFAESSDITTKPFRKLD